MTRVSCSVLALVRVKLHRGRLLRFRPSLSVARSGQSSGDCEHRSVGVPGDAGRAHASVHQDRLLVSFMPHQLQKKRFEVWLDQCRENIFSTKVCVQQDRFLVCSLVPKLVKNELKIWSAIGTEKTTVALIKGTSFLQIHYQIILLSFSFLNHQFAYAIRCIWQKLWQNGACLGGYQSSEEEPRLCSARPVPDQLHSG